MEYVIPAVVAAGLLMLVFKRGAGHAHAGGDGCCGSAGAHLPTSGRASAQADSESAPKHLASNDPAMLDQVAEAGGSGCCGGRGHVHGAGHVRAHAGAGESGCCGDHGAGHKDHDDEPFPGEVRP